MIEPNFNINLEIEKVINKIHESKTVRNWTYTIGLLVILGLVITFGGEFLKGLADLIRALKGK